MKVEEFLKKEDMINLASIARKMYPNNKTAKNHLYAKLKKMRDNRFTERDAEKALKVLKELSIEIIKLERVE